MESKSHSDFTALNLESLQQLVKALSSQVNKLEQEVARLKEEKLRLQSENASLQSKLNKDSHNSSKPPSSDGLTRIIHHK